MPSPLDPEKREKQGKRRKPSKETDCQVRTGMAEEGVAKKTRPLPV